MDMLYMFHLKKCFVQSKRKLKMTFELFYSSNKLWVVKELKPYKMSLTRSNFPV